ncbi:MAG: hypothetical protein ACYDH6_08445 [Acidimicrobiales bacterium]
MRTAGVGADLWRVRVDLVAVDATSGLVSSAAAALSILLDDDGAPGLSDVAADQGLGVADRPVIGLLFWVRADDVGAAATTAVEVARRAGAGLGVGPELYDVTVIPRQAVVSAGRSLDPSMPD